MNKADILLLYYEINLTTQFYKNVNSNITIANIMYKYNHVYI